MRLPSFLRFSTTGPIGFVLSLAMCLIALCGEFGAMWFTASTRDRTFGIMLMMVVGILLIGLVTGLYNQTRTSLRMDVRRTIVSCAMSCVMYLALSGVAAGISGRNWIMAELMIIPPALWVIWNVGAILIARFNRRRTTV